jgi:hypothetical protein
MNPSEHIRGTLGLEKIESFAKIPNVKGKKENGKQEASNVLCEVVMRNYLSS